MTTAAQTGGRAEAFQPEPLWKRALRLVTGRSQIRSIMFLRCVAIAEAIAWLSLVTFAVIHHLTGHLGMGLFVLGNVHGAIFTTYVITIFVFRRTVGWGPLMLLLVLLAGFIPTGGIMVERWAMSAPGRDERAAVAKESAAKQSSAADPAAPPG